MSGKHDHMTAWNETAEPRQTAPRRPGRLSAKIKLANAVADEILATLSHAELATWFVLWRDEKDSRAKTAQVDIARRAGLHPDTIKKAIASLKRRGLVRVLKRGGLNRGPSEYEMLNPAQGGARAPLKSPVKGAHAPGCSECQGGAGVSAPAGASAPYPSRDIQREKSPLTRAALGAAASDECADVDDDSALSPSGPLTLNATSSAGRDRIHRRDGGTP